MTGHWINQDGNVVSLDRHYSFYAMFDTNLTWVSNEASFEGIANINISNRAYNEATGKTTVNVTSTWDIPKGATIIEAGTLRTASTDQITSEQLQSATYLKKSTLKTTKGTFCITLNISAASLSKTIYAMTYVKYSYHGSEYTLYSNMVKSDPST